MMKQLLALALCAVLAVPVAASAFAADLTPTPATHAATADQESGYDIYVDGKDTGADACVMVPLRIFANQLGFAVTWNGDGTVGMDNGVMHTTITIGKDLYQVATSVEGQVGMSAPFSLGMAPFVVNGTTYVPLELFEVLLGNREGSVSLENGVLSMNTEEAENNTQIPNPFTDCDTLAAAETLVGFQLTVPASVNHSNSRAFRASNSGMLEVIYQKDGAETARIRKGLGTGDISGNYHDYPEVNTVSANGVQVIVKGDHSRVALAIWENGGYTYSITLESPISNADMVKLVSGIQ